MEFLRHQSQKGFEAFLARGYNLEVENRQNLDVLNEKPGCPAVLYFNHTTTDDPLFMYRIAYNSVPERMDNVIIPVSEIHSKFKKFPAYSALVFAGEKLWGFESPRVVQSYRLRTEGFGDEELRQKAGVLGKKLFRLIDKSLDSGPLILISPEGHRSEKGKMLPAEGGAGAIAMVMEKKVKKGLIEEGYFLPVALRVENFKGNKLYYNPVNKPHVICTIGEPVTAGRAADFARIVGGEKPDPGTISHYLMYQVARLLPEEMQGVYHPDLIEDTFRGRFELWSDERQKVYVYDNWAKGPYQDF